MGLEAAIAVFLASAVIISVAGWQLAHLADRIADRTGMGEALAGALLLGATTSLPGIISTVVTSASGHPDFAFSHAFGGIAVQMAFLSIGDISYKRANLEHAAASVENVLQATMLTLLLTIVVFTTFTPEFDVYGVHPTSLILLVVYVYALLMVRQHRNSPMWTPNSTPETETDEPDSDNEGASLRWLLLRFVAFGIVVAAGGYAISISGVAIADQTVLSDSFVGGLFTTLATSFPELITVLAAVRQGSLVLAVGDIVGGNLFDTLFVGLADVVYTGGSIYHVVGEQSQFLLGLSLMINTLLVIGLVRREKSGVANIGTESLFMLLVYAFGIGLLPFIGS